MKIMKENKAANQGFTVMEMMITLAVFAIMSLVAVPYTLGWRKAGIVNTVAMAVMSDLQEAKSLSIAKNSNVIVAYDISEKTYRFYLDENGLGIDESNLVKSVTLSSIHSGIVFGYVPGPGIDGDDISGAIVMGSTSEPIRCVFRPDGTVINRGTIYLIPATDLYSVPERQKAIHISSIGRISKWGYDASGGLVPWKEHLYE